MPINFKNIPTTNTAHASFQSAQTKVRELLDLGDDTDVSVGLSETTVKKGGVMLVLPFGLSQLSTGKDAVNKAVIDAFGLLGHPVSATPAAPVTLTDLDALEDEQWAVHVAKEFFPGVQQLHLCTDLYQRAKGTSPEAQYKVAFIGPHLRGAVKMEAGVIAFRFTTDKGECPSGEVLHILKDVLGMDTVYEDRITSHVGVPGAYGADTFPYYRATFAAFYGALKNHLTSGFPDIGKLNG